MKDNIMIEVIAVTFFLLYPTFKVINVVATQLDKRTMQPKQSGPRSTHRLGQDPLWFGLWKRISEKRMKNQAKTNKTEHGMEKREKTKLNRSQSPRKSKSTPKSQQSSPKP
ncbi:hypothetical protein Tco_1159337 [Tanacetum coccineum]